MRLSDHATAVLKHACAEAEAAQVAAVFPVHLMIALCKVGSDDVLGALKAQGMDPVTLRRRIRLFSAQLLPSKVGLTGGPEKLVDFSREARAALAAADETAKSSRRAMTSADLLLAVLKNPDEVLSVVIRKEGLDIGRLKRALASSEDGHGPAEPGTESVRAQESTTPLLDRLGIDYSARAREGKLDPLIGRRHELVQISRVLFRKEKNNLILVGEAGVGKTRIVEGLAQYGCRADAPSELQQLRVVGLDPGSLTAGTKYRGDLEERLLGILKEVGQSPNLVLFLDEIHSVLSGENEAASTVANIIKPALTRGQFRCIGATTPAEFDRHISQDAALARRFEQVRVDEPTPGETLQMLDGLRKAYEVHHRVHLTDEALESAIEYSVRYMPERRLPDKARDIIDRAAVSKRIVTLSRWGTSPPQAEPLVVDRTDIASTVAEMTGLPVRSLTEDMKSRLARLEEALAERVIGQDSAIANVARVVRTALAGFAEPDRPYGVLLFAGPSGVGKTELARALAQVLFSDEKRLLRFDMSEYMEEHSVSKLIGSPPGYVGYKDPGRLSDAVRGAPYSVVLLDEIEKAHPRIFDLFLQVFDNGYFTDSQGRRVDFRNAVIVLTSNLNRNALKKRAPVGFRAVAEESAPVASSSEQRDFLLAHFRPEFVNRLSDVIEFHPLERAHLRRIVDKLMRTAASRLSSRGITLALTEAAQDLVIGQGYDAQFGARELGRAFQQLVVDALAAKVVAGDIQSGLVEVDAKANRIVFVQSPPSGPPPSSTIGA